MDFYEEDENEAQIGKGGQGTIFKVHCKSDGKVFAMKMAENCSEVERQMIINEASLISYLQIDEMVQCLEVYEHNDCLFLILEYMDQKSMSNIVQYSHEHYSEDFCKYTVYKVGLGLSKMHNHNVLHRDIKSENILSSSDGEIKIADL